MNFKGTKIEQVKEHTLYFEGKSQTLAVYRIPISLLTYNIQNGRIGTHVKKYNSENPNNNLRAILDQDKEEFNKQISEYIISSSTKKTFTNTKNDILKKSQQLPGVVLDDGIIIDGNRRFTALRELSKEYPDGRFEYFDAVILEKPQQGTAREKAIKILEIELQRGVDEKVDYSPIEKLVDLYNNVNFTEYENQTNRGSLLSEDQYIEAANISKPEFTKMKHNMEIMIDFCEFFKFDDKFYIVDDLKLDGPINEIRNFRNKFKSEKDREKYDIEIKPIIYNILILASDGDLTRNLRGFLNGYDDWSSDTEVIKQLDKISESTYDQMRKVPEGNEKELIQTLRSSGDAGVLSRVVNEVVDSTRRAKKQQQPVNNVRDAIKSISRVDSDNFAYMNSNTKYEMKSELQLLRENILSLLEKL